MRRARTRVSCNCRYRTAVELYCETWRQIMRDEDRVRPARQIDRVVILQSQQHRQNADVYVGQIRHAFADVVEQFDIIEHRHLDIEDGSLLLSGVRAYTISNLEQTCTCTSAPDS